MSKARLRVSGMIPGDSSDLPWLELAAFSQIQCCSESRLTPSQNRSARSGCCSFMLNLHVSDMESAFLTCSHLYISGVGPRVFSGEELIISIPVHKGCRNKLVRNKVCTQSGSDREGSCITTNMIGWPKLSNRKPDRGVGVLLIADVTFKARNNNADE